MTYEEECASLVQDNDEHDDVMRDRAVKAWESAGERARAAEQLADNNDALCRRWLVACDRAQDELAAIKGALRLLRTFVGSL